MRHRGDSNPCGQSPMDFESISLTARTQCLKVLRPTSSPSKNLRSQTKHSAFKSQRAAFILEEGASTCSWRRSTGHTLLEYFVHIHHTLFSSTLYRSTIWGPIGARFTSIASLLTYPADLYNARSLDTHVCLPCKFSWKIVCAPFFALLLREQKKQRCHGRD